MFRLSSILIFSILISFTVYSQEYSLEPGVISDAEWDLETYEQDSDASAVVLFDIGNSIFETRKDGSLIIRLKRKKRIKILDKNALDVAEITIPFYVFNKKESEKVIDLQAYTYAKNGDELVKKQVRPESVFEEKYNENWKAKKFTFPDAQSGSILEYSYTLETPILPDWKFQTDIPTVHSEYKVGMVPFFEYVCIAQGIDTFNVYTIEKDETWKKFGQITSYSGQNLGEASTYQDVNYTFVLKDVAAFKDEEYITSVNDYIAKIDFQLSNSYSLPASVSNQYASLGQTKVYMTTWPKMVEDLLEADYFGKYLNVSEKLVGKIIKSELELDGKTKAQQARMIIDYVKNNFKWNGIHTKYARLKPKEFIAQKQGNSVEINLLLTAMLRAADIQAQPVIISTRDHGKIKADYPFQHFFNHVVTLVNEPGFTYLADATDPLIAYNRIPPRCINEKGLIVNQENGGWVNLESKILSLNNKLLTINIDPEALIASAGVTIQASEYYAYAYKNAFGKNEQEVKASMRKQGFDEVSDVRFINYEKHTKPLVIAFKASAEIEEIGDKIVLSPFFDFPISENDLTQKERKYPVDMTFANASSFKSQIAVPEGYQVSGLPTGIDLKEGDASVKLKYTLNGSQLIVEGSYAFNKAVFQPEEYVDIKDAFDMIVEKFNQQIVFEPL